MGCSKSLPSRSNETKHDIVREDGKGRPLNLDGGKQKVVAISRENVNDRLLEPAPKLTTLQLSTDFAVDTDVREAFENIYTALRESRSQLGGAKLSKSKKDPVLPEKKITRKQLRHYSDYEYIFLTILGFQKIHENAQEIIALNNGKYFQQNPGTQRLEAKCSMTMHGDRKGANAIIRSSPETLVRAFKLSCSVAGGPLRFFNGAFCRTADPCLEGRFGRILAFIEKISTLDFSNVDRPWEDFAVKPLTGRKPEEIIGEYLRVFTNETIFEWGKRENIPYSRAKELHSEIEDRLTPTHQRILRGFLTDMDVLCNTRSFMDYLHSEGVCPKMVSEEDVVSVCDLFVSLDTLAPGPEHPAFDRLTILVANATLSVDSDSGQSEMLSRSRTSGTTTTLGTSFTPGADIFCSSKPLLRQHSSSSKHTSSSKGDALSIFTRPSAVKFEATTVGTGSKHPGNSFGMTASVDTTLPAQSAADSSSNDSSNRSQ